jgi:hypothetical protein
MNNIEYFFEQVNLWHQAPITGQDTKERARSLSLSVGKRSGSLRTARSEPVLGQKHGEEVQRFREDVPGLALSDTLIESTDSMHLMRIILYPKAYRYDSHWDRFQMRSSSRACVVEISKHRSGKIVPVKQ